MRIFLDTYFGDASIHSTMTSYLIGQTLKGLDGWNVVFYNGTNPEDLCSALANPDNTLAVYSHNLFAIRNGHHRRIIRKALLRSRGVRLFFIEDVMAPRWWASMVYFHGFLGPVLYPSPAYQTIIRSHWVKPDHKGTMHFLPHGVPFDRPFDPSFVHKKVLFPSRTFVRSYPHRLQWREFIDANPDLRSRCAYLDKTSGLYGHDFVDYIGTFQACLVVVTLDGYLIRKLYETILAGSLLLVAFPKNSMGDAARTTWNELGFKDGVHYLEVTLENFEEVMHQVLDSDKYKDLPRQAYDEAMANHRVNGNRLERFLHIVDSYK